MAGLTWNLITSLEVEPSSPGAACSPSVRPAGLFMVSDCIYSHCIEVVLLHTEKALSALVAEGGLSKQAGSGAGSLAWMDSKGLLSC